MKQREIHLANLNPTVSNEQSGIRPVVVISGNTMNSKSGLCVICPLSSVVKNYPFCTLLSKNNSNLSKNNSNKLKQDSEVLSFQLRTISQKRLIKKIGEVEEEDLQSVLHNINDVFRF